MMSHVVFVLHNRFQGPKAELVSEIQLLTLYLALHCDLQAHEYFVRLT